MIHLSENEHISFPVLKLKTVIVRKSFMSLAICRCSLSGSLAKIRKIHSFISMPSLKHSKPVCVLAFYSFCSRSTQHLNHQPKSSRKSSWPKSLIGLDKKWANWALLHPSHMKLRRLNFYRPPTKLQEGNIFTGVILSMGWGARIFLVRGPFYWVGYLWSHVRSVRGG